MTHVYNTQNHSADNMFDYHDNDVQYVRVQKIWSIALWLLHFVDCSSSHTQSNYKLSVYIIVYVWLFF